MVNCNPSQTPIETESKLGSDVQQAYIYMHDPREPHFLALKRILRYIGLTVLLLDAQLQVTVFFLATTYSLGPLSVSRRFLVPVQRRSIVVRIRQKSQENHKKMGKHGHENGRVNKSRKQSQEKVKLQSKGSQTQSNPVKLCQTQNDKTKNNSFLSLNFQKWSLTPYWASKPLNGPEIP
ncbi:hypothetical protein Tco_1171490 [Tanacetum coccineum]